jgi:hypothetical protein
LSFRRNIPAAEVAEEEVVVVGLEAGAVTAVVGLRVEAGRLAAVELAVAVTAAVGLRVAAGRLAAVMVEPVVVEPAVVELAAELEAELTRTFTVPTLNPGRLFPHSHPAHPTTSRFFINSPTAPAGL